MGLICLLSKWHAEWGGWAISASIMAKLGFYQLLEWFIHALQPFIYIPPKHTCKHMHTNIFLRNFKIKNSFKTNAEDVRTNRTLKGTLGWCTVDLNKAGLRGCQPSSQSKILINFIVGPLYLQFLPTQMVYYWSIYYQNKSACKWNYAIQTLSFKDQL